MFGVTTPACRQVTAALEADYDCLVFHATGTGGQSMEKLVDSGLLAGVIDVTTTEVCDLLLGGVFAGDRGSLRRDHPHRAPLCRLGAARSTWSISARLDTVPESYRAAISTCTIRTSR